MKKLLIICCFSLLLTASMCTKPDPIVLHKIDVSLETSNLMRNFKAYKPSDEEMVSIDSKKSQLLIQAFIYDEDGRLLDYFSQLADDYGASYSFSTSVECASPTIVAFSYCIVGNASSPSYQAYVVSGQKSLGSLQITSDDKFGKIKWLVLGGVVKKMGPNEHSASLSLSPLGALVYFDFTNVHAHDKDAKAPDSYVYQYKSNDIVRVEDGTFVYDTSLASSQMFYTSVDPSDFPDYNGVYDIEFMQPGTFDTAAFYWTGSTRNYFHEGIETVRAGKQYAVMINCSSFSVDFREGTI